MKLRIESPSSNPNDVKITNPDTGAIFVGKTTGIDIVIRPGEQIIANIQLLVDELDIPTESKDI